jgi:hypothetical protein
MFVRGTGINESVGEVASAAARDADFFSHFGAVINE